MAVSKHWCERPPGLSRGGLFIGIKVKQSFGLQGTTGTPVTSRFGPRFVYSLSQAMGHQGYPGRQR